MARSESNPFLAQLKERLAEAEAKLAKAQASGDPQRIAKAEAEVSRRKSLLPGAEPGILRARSLSRWRLSAGRRGRC